MPARQPFTALCRALAQPSTQGRADLHVHTTCSDGVYRPAQIVELARRAGLAAVAITDHDTLAGVEPARQAATNVEIIAGVEITAEHHDHELHLLGYFISVDNAQLRVALARLHERRAERFREMVDRLRAFGIELDRDAIRAPMGATLGRRHLADLLVRTGKAANIREAFQRWLGDRGRVNTPKARLPAAEAIALVRQAGGVAAWAHPSYDATIDSLQELRDVGLQAIEVDYPHCRHSRTLALRGWAKELGLAVTGGSDCHGPEQPARGLGSCSVTDAELAALRQLAHH
jgi:predicted metal-dependent phosphoesterase TrpH